jgi:hypothetical protein
MIFARHEPTELLCRCLALRSRYARRGLSLRAQRSSARWTRATLAARYFFSVVRLRLHGSLLPRSEGPGDRTGCKSEAARAIGARAGEGRTVERTAVALA